MAKVNKIETLANLASHEWLRQRPDINSIDVAEKAIGFGTGGRG